MNTISRCPRCNEPVQLGQQVCNRCQLPLGTAQAVTPQVYVPPTSQGVQPNFGLPHCTNCGQTDGVRKVSAIYSEGASVTNTTGYAGNQRVSARSIGFTDLSRKLAPPTKPFDPTILLILTIVMAVFSLCGIGMALAMRDATAAGSGGSIIGCFPPCSIIFLLVFGGQYLYFRNQYKVKMPLWERAKPKWDQLYYCMRCDTAMIPNQPLVIPSDHVQSFLYS